MDSFARNTDEAKLLNKFIKSGNSHIFYFWDKLNDEEKDLLIQELSQIDLKIINDNYKKYLENNKTIENEYKPAEYLSIQNRKDLNDIKLLGENSLKKGEIAFLTVAGGQASRLGYDNPKGCFQISAIKQKSLFQIFAEKISFYSSYYNINLKWFIMTSESNYKDTLHFFINNNYFNLKKDNIIFFKQNMSPTINIEGKLILDQKNKLFLNPDGHGGTLKSLLKIGLLNEMKKDKIKYLYYFQIDNPLVYIADPYFIGYHIKEKSQVTTKVVKKLYPDEKLGSIVKKNNHNAIVEYSDIPKELMFEKDQIGNLKFSMGSIGIHIFNVDFLLKFTKNLPIHYAKKSIEAYYYNKETQKMEYGTIDGIKFETFIFDVILFAEKSAFYETEREDDFSPLKNKTGVDSIETCNNGEINQHFNWVLESRLIKKIPDDKILEISPLYAPDKNIFLEKVREDSDKLKETIFNKDGSIKDEIYIK